MASLRDANTSDVLALPVRTLVVDDEGPSRDRVRSLLERDCRVELVGECANGVEALHAIEDEGPDLVFLDVEMPELSGLAMLEALAPERCPQVVFVTAYDKYLQYAFEVHALDYLRKPFTDERFYDALDDACRRVQERLGHLTTHEGVLALLEAVRERSGRDHDRMVVREKELGIYHVVWTHDIDCIEANNGGVLIHVGKKTFASRHTLTEVEKRIEPDVFMRIHRSFIVNRRRVITVKPLWKGEFLVTLASGKAIGTGRTYRAAVEAFLEFA